MQKAVNAGVAAQSKQKELEADDAVCASAASSALGVANAWARDNYADLAASIDFAHSPAPALHAATREATSRLMRWGSAAPRRFEDQHVGV